MQEDSSDGKILYKNVHVTHNEIVLFYFIFMTNPWNKHFSRLYFKHVHQRRRERKLPVENEKLFTPERHTYSSKVI